MRVVYTILESFRKRRWTPSLARHQAQAVYLGAHEHGTYTASKLSMAKIFR